jgi:hypothetical protein
MSQDSNLNRLDVLLVLKLLAHPERDWTYKEIGESLGVSASQAFSSVRQAARSGLLYSPALHGTVNRANIKEFLIHGLKYAFPAHRGSMTRGMPTSHAGPPLNSVITDSSEPPPVWPMAQGSVRGLELAPLYKTAPKAAHDDPILYEYLVLVDAIREGRAREREIAVRELSTRLESA